jgi:RHS repeat-associated protein
VVENYGYSPAGQMTWKQMVHPWGTLSASWGYDAEGRLGSVTYPDRKQYTFGYDGADRNNALTWYDQSYWVSVTATYGYRGEMQWMHYPYTSAGDGWSQSWSYNALGQMTNYWYSLSGTWASYNYGATPAAGKLESASLNTGAVSYGYDSLGRLTSATASNWSQTFTYDGFGNLLRKAATGAAWPAGQADYWVDPRTNRWWNTDAAGNLTVNGATYDYLNRMERYWERRFVYDPSNRRVVQYEYVPETSQISSRSVTFWAGSKRLSVCTYGPQYGYEGDPIVLKGCKNDLYIGGRRVAPQDRLGSDITNGRVLLPYGEELTTTSTSGNDRIFATYARDGWGLDYADQRYYRYGEARFMSADPYLASGGVGDPSSWNRYAYVQGDPVNRVDPKGLFWEAPSLMAPDGGVMWTSSVDGGYGLFVAAMTQHGPEGSVLFNLPLALLAGVGGGGGAGAAVPSNKGGWDTDPRVAARTAWQYLTSIWKDCLNFFKQDSQFDSGGFSELLRGGITWYDTRSFTTGSIPVGSILGNDDGRTLRAYVGSADAAVLPGHAKHVALGQNYFQNNTQTQQVATMITRPSMST